MRKALLTSCAWLAFSTLESLAQSNPGLFFKQVPTATQWNSYFSSKVDYPALFANPNLWTNNQTFTASIVQQGATSGAVTLNVQSIAGTFNWNWPTSSGTLGQAFISGGGGSTPNSWSTLGASAFTDTTNASNITSGTLSTTLLPSPFRNGVASGNTSTFATANGTLTNGDCVKIDANKNFIDAGGACTTGGITALTGDVTATGPGSVTATLATVNSGTGSFGGASSISTFTVNAKGLVTVSGSVALSASNITQGTLAAAQGGAGTVTGALKGNGAGVVSQAACADLSNSAASCSTDTTNATNISSGTLSFSRLPAAVASLTAADQTVSGGANVTSDNLGTVTSGTLTIDCGARPLQFFTNNGTMSIGAPSNDGSCLVLMTNGASAAIPTFSGFTVGSSTGDALTNTNGNKFTFSIWRINGTSGYRAASHQ